MKRLFLLFAALVAIQAHAAAMTHGQYRVDYSMNRAEGGELAIRLRVVDTKTNDVLAEPSITTKAGQAATTQFARGQHDFTVTVQTNDDGSGALNMVVRREGREIQNTVTKFPAPGKAATREYTGQPITLQLAKADIRDVLSVFGQLTGLEIVAPVDVRGTVNVNIVDIPWDQAFEQILHENGLSYRIEGKRIDVFRP